MLLYNDQNTKLQVFAAANLLVRAGSHRGTCLDCFGFRKVKSEKLKV